jgi:hypothetical protein
VQAYPHCWYVGTRDYAYWQEGQEVRVEVTAEGGATVTTNPTVIDDEAKPTIQLFSTMNTGGVANGPTQPTMFTLARPTRIIKITTYHWNNGRGATPGTIALRSSTGQTYGPWQAAGTPGMGGVANAHWVVTPNITLPAGTYTVVDSNPATWSHNPQSGNAAMRSSRRLPADVAVPC